MPDVAADLVALLPATGEVSFDSWKQSIMTQTGRPLGNRGLVAVKRSGNVVIHKDRTTGVLMIGRKPGGA